MGGTIIEDHGEVPDSMKAALAKGGIAVSLAEIGDWRGASKRQMVRHFVELRTKPNADRERLIESVYRDFSARASKAYANVKPIAGAEDAFRTLRAKGFLLATNTGFDRNLADLILDRLDWKGHFTATVASDEVADGRPSPYMIFHAMEAARVERVAVTRLSTFRLAAMRDSRVSSAFFPAPERPNGCSANPIRTSCQAWPNCRRCSTRRSDPMQNAQTDPASSAGLTPNRSQLASDLRARNSAAPLHASRAARRAALGLLQTLPASVERRGTSDRPLSIQGIRIPAWVWKDHSRVPWRI
jgi:phosphoglycolate phosphatase-like HAD superfamily hydrolase